MGIFVWIKTNSRQVLSIALTIIAILAGVMIWDKIQTPKLVTFERQQEAATPAGVEKAANAAEVPISPAQAEEIANAIATDGEKPPETVVRTTGEKLADTIKTELQKSGAQFAIVTDSKKADGKTGDAPANAGAISANTPITMNQYNIKAYPDRLIQVGGSYQEVFAAYSWKVNVPKIPLLVPHGCVGYFGFYSHADFSRPDKSKIGVTLTIPK